MSRSPETVAHSNAEFAATEFVEARRLVSTRTRDTNHRPQPPRKKSISNKRTGRSREAGGIWDCDMDESCISLGPERRATSRGFLGARRFSKEGIPGEHSENLSTGISGKRRVTPWRPPS